MHSINNLSIKELLPSSISYDKQVIASCEAIDLEMKKLQSAIQKLYILPSIETLEEDMVDLMAKQFDAPYYDATLPLETKRNLVKNAINWHKKKGTVAAVEEVVSTIFGESTVEEWYEYGGEPHHFRITTTNISTDESFIDKFKEAAEHVKRKSSWLDEVIVLLASELGIYIGFALHTGDRITIRQEG